MRSLFVSRRQTSRDSAVASQLPTHKRIHTDLPYHPSCPVVGLVPKRKQDTCTTLVEVSHWPSAVLPLSSVLDGRWSSPVSERSRLGISYTIVRTRCLSRL